MNGAWKYVNESCVSACGSLALFTSTVIIHPFSLQKKNVFTKLHLLLQPEQESYAHNKHTERIFYFISFYFLLLLCPINVSVNFHLQAQKHEAARCVPNHNSLYCDKIPTAVKAIFLYVVDTKYHKDLRRFFWFLRMRFSTWCRMCFERDVELPSDTTNKDTVPPKPNTNPLSSLIAFTV